MLKKIVISLIGISAAGAVLYWQSGKFQSDEASLPAPVAQDVTQPVSESQTAQEFFQKLQQIKQDKSEPVAAEMPVEGSADMPLSPDDEPVAAAGHEVPVNIGQLIDPELDDPNTGLPESEPVSIGELLDPETYIPPSPENETEINIGEFIPMDDADSPVATTDGEQPIESGPELAADADPESSEQPKLQQL